MGQLQKVSWRTVGYTALGTLLAAASVVVIINSDGVRPTSLTSNAATRWLVDQVNGTVVLVDGLAGRVVAKVDAESPGSSEVAVQGVGGAFLVAQDQGSVRSISTAKLQLGTAQPVASLLDRDVKFGVGASGLTVVSSKSGTANVVAVDDVARPVKISKSDNALVAADGSMWLITGTQAKHVNVDGSTTAVQMPTASTNTTTVGAHGVAYDNINGLLRWIGGNDIALQQSLRNSSDAVLQEPGDDAQCVWLGVDDTLKCIGPTKIEQTLTIAGMHLSAGSHDRLAVAGDTAVVVRDHNVVARIDLENHRMADDKDIPSVPAGAAKLTITASGNLVWLDDRGGDKAWVANRFGINTIDKNDARAQLLDAQGQVKAGGDGTAGPGTGNGNTAGEDNADHLDHNGHEDPPHATDDSVTARAGATVTIPVTSNDWDPDGDPFAVSAVGADSGRSAGSGTVDILDANTVAYVPNPGFSGIDSFDYTIVDPSGETSTATVTVELFPPGSPNRPPIARPDKAFTQVGHPITIDVLANDSDPERGTLAVAPFRQNAAGISDAIGPTGRPALKYDPPDVPGIYTFTYQAVDPQGGTSEKTLVTVTVSGVDAQNSPPEAHPDSIRLRVGVEQSVNVKANDTDPDGDDLTISLPQQQPKGVTVRLQGQQLYITLQPGAQPRTLVEYLLTDNLTKPVTGSVLVLRIDDTAPNRPPVANPDSDRVVIGNSVKIPVTANDVDPDNDAITLLSAADPVDGSGTATVEGNSVRFTPNLPDITQPTTVTFTYKISDGHNHEATGKVTVTVLLQALPKAPFARDDFADTETDKPVTIDVLANDTDPSGGGKPHLTTNPVCASGGDAKRTPDDRVTFTPPRGQTGTFACKYRVINAQGLGAEASIIVTVTAPKPGNQAPTINDGAMHPSVNLGDTLTFNANVLATDADGNPLVFSAVSKPAHGTTNFSGQTSTFTYTAPPPEAADQTPDADNIQVIISDELGGNVPGTLTIKLNAVPTTTTTTPTPLPPNTRELATVATTGVNLPYDVVSQLRDINVGDTLTLVAASGESGPGTAQAVNGVVNIVPTGAGLLTVNYTVQNAAGVQKSDKLKVTIVDPPPTNPPKAVDDSLTVSSGGVGSVNLVANDLGISDPNDKPVATLNNKPPASFGTVDVQNNVLTFVAAPGADGASVTLTYTLKDGSGLQSTAQVVITVQACSESPPKALDASVFTPYMTPIEINLGLYIVSGNLVPGSVSGAGMTGLTGTYTPPEGMNGTEVVTFVVENGCHHTDVGQLTIDVNHSPVGGTINPTMSAGDSLTLTVRDLASDDEPLTITDLASTAPPWASFDATTVTLAPPPETRPGDYTFTATVQDPGGLTAVATITITIIAPPPTAVPDQYETPKSLFTFNPTQNDTDPDHGQLCVQTISVVSPPETDIIPPNPVPECSTDVTVSLAHGVSTLNYTIVDKKSGRTSTPATITITSNNPPTINDASAETNGQLTAETSLRIADVDGDSIISDGCDSQPGFVATLRAPYSEDPDWELEVTVSPDFKPTDPVLFTCTIRDAFSSATATMTLTVN
jgi:large repetitive protein